MILLDDHGYLEHFCVFLRGTAEELEENIESTLPNGGLIQDICFHWRLERQCFRQRQLISGKCGVGQMML